MIMTLIKKLLIFSALIFIAPGISAEQILKIVIEGDINPVSAKYIVDNVQKAEKGDYECLLIQMDTPGGLLESTKTIVKEILNADVPVVMYVSPSGSGAVSAGVFITMACHVAAMAEGTNIGAAHPVGVGGQQDTSKVMGEKVTNYASAWMRGIAEKRGRNADWAEKAVRESVSINEQEALDLNVIDLVAKNEKELLEAIDGDEILLEKGTVTLSTKNADIVLVEMNWRNKILYNISNPTIAYILLMLGIYGIFFELSNPGSVIPGVVGGIFIILAFFALQTLPVRGAGLLLVLFAIVLFILEVKVTSFGILTIGGIVAMFLGSIMLFDEAPGFAFHVDWRVAAAVALSTGIFFAFAMGMALKARLTKPSTGKEGIVGERGMAITSINPNGNVKIHGEIWNAVSSEKIKKGDKIKVNAVDGLELKVDKLG
jgi:membrane-bound serine protease (ClpP class)